MLSNNVPRADNQQETLQNFFYYTGFCCGEMSCSLLKLSNRKSKSQGVYYTPDITVSNADKLLLQEVNQYVAGGIGVISPIKGGYNLSFRGKNKVKTVLGFFDKYPPIVGDIALSKLTLVKNALKILENSKGWRRSPKQEKQLEEIRDAFVQLKRLSFSSFQFSQQIFEPSAIGYFLCGILDAEGSVGLKQSGFHKQPFIAVAMKDKKIVELFKHFLKLGHIHFRPKENVYHFEMGSRREVLHTLQLFSNTYPSKLLKMRKRIQALQWILNDYTQGSLTHKLQRDMI